MCALIGRIHNGCLLLLNVSKRRNQPSTNNLNGLKEPKHARMSQNSQRKEFKRASSKSRRILNGCRLILNAPKRRKKTTKMNLNRLKKESKHVQRRHKRYPNGLIPSLGGSSTGELLVNTPRDSKKR